MNTPAYYAILPARVRYDKSLRPMEKIMFAEITALSNKDGYCSAGNGYFADLYDVAQETVSRWIGNLAKHGHVSLQADPNTGHDRKITPLDKKIKAPRQKDQGPLDKKIIHNTTSIIIQDNIIREGETSVSTAPTKPKKTRFKEPTSSEVENIFKEKLREKKVSGADFIARRESEKFYFHYCSNGWHVGKNKMKSLPHAVGAWITRMDQYNNNNFKNKLDFDESPIDKDEAHAIIAHFAENGFGN